MSIQKIDQLKIIESELSVLHSLHASANWLDGYQSKRLSSLLLLEIKQKLEEVEKIILSYHPN
ncbi:MAG: hypothetical protein BVN34_06385 [Proteobacteria bacterium ST_bin12]|nr:MAG: hypothetical protein BVN34_06385 [Proteobacteria bacterium ST_bin12]